MKKKGPKSRFVRTAPGTFGLRSWPVQDLSSASKPTMSFTDAAEAVLEASDKHEAMHYKVITKPGSTELLRLTAR